MDRRQEIALLRRAQALAAAGGSELLGSMGEAPASQYTDPARFEQEMACIFRRQPMAVAHVTELAGDDSFVTVDTPRGALLITRDADGQLRVFHNVCRHRGTRLVEQANGCARRFSCPYHAWTYANTGALVGVPHADTAFPELDRGRHGLVPLDSVVRHGLVWVGIDAAGFDAYLQGLGPDLDWLGLADLRRFATEERIWQANWKLIAEGGLEAYHFRQAHTSTIAPYFYDNLNLWDRYGDHFRNVLPRRSLAQLEDEDETAWSLRAHSHMTYSLFPMTLFLVQSDHIVWIQARPLAPEQTRVRLVTLVPQQLDRPDSYWQTNHEITRSTLDEDFALAESIQAGLASGANAALLFGRNEGALTEFNAVVSNHLQAIRQA